MSAVTDASHIAVVLASALPETHAWSGRPVADDLAALPGGPALYLLTDAGAAPVQLATTQSLRRVLLARLADPDRKPRRADLAEVARGVRWRPLSTAFEGRWWYYRVARELYPNDYRRRIAFGPAWFLQVNWTDAVPELRATERVWVQPGEFVGPWPTHRAARETLELLWDLFDLCRYPEQVRKAPQGTRCAYAEMNRCDAPCDGSVPLSAYSERCRAAWRFVTGGSLEWAGRAALHMKQAAAQREYEVAARLKQHVQVAEAWHARWAGNVQRAERMDVLLGFRAARRRAWKLFRFRRGELIEGPVVTARKVGSGALAWLDAQPEAPPAETAPAVRMEQTWLYGHELYGSERDFVLLVTLPEGRAPHDLAAVLADQMSRIEQEGRRRRGARPSSGSNPAAPMLPENDEQ